MANGVSYGYDARNRLLSASDGTTYGYTKRGTLLTETKGGTTTLSKTDALGRVVSTGPVNYSYDNWDRLISRTQNGTTNNFVFAGLETDPAADGTATYSRSPGGSVIATTSGTTTRWTGMNRHGDITQLLDPAATNPLIGSQTFDPFGQPISAPALNLGYQGDWTDPTTKQPWMAARWYQPNTATFTTRDTLLGSVGGPTVAHNRHTYANNNPLTYWDPTGRYAVHDDCFYCVSSDFRRQIGTSVGEALDAWENSAAWSGTGPLDGLNARSVLDTFCSLVTGTENSDLIRLATTCRSFEVVPLSCLPSLQSALNDEGVSEQSIAIASHEYRLVIKMNLFLMSGRNPRNQNDQDVYWDLYAEDIGYLLEQYIWAQSADPGEPRWSSSVVGVAAASLVLHDILRPKGASRQDAYSALAEVGNASFALLAASESYFGGGQFSVDATSLCPNGCTLQVREIRTPRTRT